MNTYQTNPYLTDEERLDVAQQAAVEQATLAAQSTVELSNLPAEESDRIKRATIAGKALQETDLPRFNDRLDPSSVTKAPPTSIKKVGSVASSNGVTPSKNGTKSIFDHAAKTETNRSEKIAKAKAQFEHELAAPHTDEQMVTSVVSLAKAPFPNLAREIVKLSLGVEKYQTEQKLNVYKKQVEDRKAKIDLLLKLSAQLPKVNSDDGSYKLKEETKHEISRLAKELRAKGIDLFPRAEKKDKDGKTIVSDEIEEFTQAELLAANSDLGHHMDVARTDIQTIFTTGFSVVIQFMATMNEVSRKIIDYQDRLISKTTRAAVGG